MQDVFYSSRQNSLEAVPLTRHSRVSSPILDDIFLFSLAAGELNIPEVKCFW